MGIPEPIQSVLGAIGSLVSRAETCPVPVQPMAPMVKRPAAAKTKKGALQACSAKVKTVTRTLAASSGRPRQTREYAALVVGTHANTVFRVAKASKVARVLE